MAMATSSPSWAHASSALFSPSQPRPAITSLLTPQPRYSKRCELRGLTAVFAHSRKHILKTIREGEICEGFVRRDAKGTIEHQRNGAVLNATENEGDVSGQTEDIPQEPVIAARPKLVKKKAKISAKPIDEQKLTLRFLWLEKNIGIGLDLQVPGHGTIPLSPFYFWPKKDAWEEIKAKLESKSWISQRRMIILLNQVTDIINLWQQKATSA